MMAMEKIYYCCGSQSLKLAMKGKFIVSGKRESDSDIEYTKISDIKQALLELIDTYTKLQYQCDVENSHYQHGTHDGLGRSIIDLDKLINKMEE